MADIDDRTKFRFSGGQIFGFVAAIGTLVSSIIGGVWYGSRLIGHIEDAQASDRRETQSMFAEHRRDIDANSHAIRDLLSDHAARFDKLTDAINNLAVRVAENHKP